MKKLTTKKIKLESDFNILRELYLNKENRNILKELLKYVDKTTSGKFMKSFLPKKGRSRSICLNCFNYDRNIYTCACEKNFKLCHECFEEHIDKYTKITGIEPSEDTIEDAKYIYDFCLELSHKCESKYKKFCFYVSEIRYVEYLKKYGINCKPSILLEGRNKDFF